MKRIILPIILLAFVLVAVATMAENTEKIVTFDVTKVEHRCGRCSLIDVRIRCGERINDVKPEDLLALKGKEIKVSNLTYVFQREGWVLSN